jgi:hypothetical protein
MKNSSIYSVLALSLGMAVANAQTLKSTKVAGFSEKDINAKEWEKAVALVVPVQPQNIIQPAFKNATITEVSVKSINDGRSIAFLLEWKDSSRNAMVDTKVFSDQVAIQFPQVAASEPSFMMGNQGGRVHIIHWKAIWQDDIEKGYRDVKTAHPNYWSDMYYFSKKENAVNEPAEKEKYANSATVDQFKSVEGRNYMHGAYAGNPMSLFDRKQPAEELIAEGYGTLTTQAIQNSNAWGVYEKGVWKVMITRPLASEDNADAKLTPKTQFAIAVWDGAAENRGGRKHYSMWSELQVVTK